jgi:hypothetical protein
MTAKIHSRQVLRRAALATAAVLLAAPAALADPPGYLFQDFAPCAPVVASTPQPPQPASATAASPVRTGQAATGQSTGQPKPIR